VPNLAKAAGRVQVVSFLISPFAHTLPNSARACVCVCACGCVRVGVRGWRGRVGRRNLE
jgi:hypothetical protein